jgi:hypothetical protein
MALVSLCLLSSATARMPFAIQLFGATGWRGLFGPVFCTGAVLLLVRRGVCLLGGPLHRL